MAGLAVQVQADLGALALGRVVLAVRVLGTVGHLTIPAGLVPQLAHLAHLVGSWVTTNRVKLARTPVNPPVNPQLPVPKLNLPG